MRFNEIVVDAYGPFSDLCMEFSAEPNFHIIYGLNEAGKSSLLRAIHSLLFGISQKTPDAFLHDYPALKITAAIEAKDGQTLEFSRVKKKRLEDSLRRANGQTLSPAELSKMLGEQTEETFVSLYGLDHEELRRGGKDMLAGRGDLGRALFESGGAGAIRRILMQYRAQAEEIFTPRAQRPLNKSLKQIEDNRKAIRALLVRPSEWQVLVKEKSDRFAALEELRQQDSSLRTEIDQLKRIYENQKDLALRDALETKLSELGVVPVLASDFTEQRVRLTAEIERIQTELETQASEQSAATIELASLPETFPFVAAEAPIAALVRGLEGYRNSLKDLQKRQKTSQDAYTEASGIWRRLFPDLDFATIENLRLTPKQSQELHGLLKNREVRLAQLQIEQQRLEETRNKLSIERDKLRDTATPIDVSTLRAVVEEIKGEGPIEEQLKRARSARELADKALQQTLHALPIWTGSAEELSSLVVPLSETVERFAKRQELEQQQVSDIERDLDRCKKEQRETQELIDRLAEGKVLPTLEQMHSERGARDRGWQLIRRVAIEQDLTLHEAEAQYEPPKAIGNAFEAHLREADGAADRLIDDSQRVAQHEQLQRRHAQLIVDRGELLKRMGVIASEVERTQAEWIAQWHSFGALLLSAREMQGWMRKRDAVLEAQVKAVGFATEVAHIESNLDSAKLRVVKALLECEAAPMKEGETLASVLLRAAALVHEQERLSDERRELEVKIREMLADIPKMEQAVERLLNQGADWETRWNLATVRFSESYRSPEVLEKILQELPELFTKWDTHCDFNQRVQAIKSDVEGFHGRVAVLCARIAPELSDVPSEIAVEKLEQLLKRDESAQRRRSELTVTLNKLESSLKLNRSRLERVSAELQKLCVQAKVDNADELPAVERRVEEAKELKTQVRTLEETLIRRNGKDLSDIEREMADGSFDQLQTRLLKLQSYMPELESAREEAVRKLRDAERQLQEQENSAAYEEAVLAHQMAISQSIDLAEKYVQKQLAVKVLEKAMESYRDRNQAKVVAQAGRIFASLTDGRFEGLLADSEDGEASRLFVLRARDRSRLEVSSLSDGTADQLFLALRLASIEQRATTMEPLPCIFDDILVNYDDVRTAAALRQLAEFSRTTQVLLFTHHPRTVELAEKHCTSRFALHSLGGELTNVQKA